MLTNRSLSTRFSMPCLLILGALALNGCGILSPNDISGAAALTENVSLSSGALQGNARDASGILSFKGVPYAAAPVGDLRWKAPQPTANWTGVRPAQTYGNKCWEFSPAVSLAAANGHSEDCLFLNVWSGAQKVSERQPVMVWIHGGGLQFGTSGDPRWEGAKLAQKGVVVVSINYRLGVFGFFSHPELNTDSGGRSSGNYGLRDQLAALRWVKANIARFGGDPGNVTVFGESAGAHSIGLLTTAPQATGSFDKVIAESGAFLESEFGPVPSRAAAEQQGTAFASSVGTNNLAALRAVPEQTLAQAAGTFSGPPFSASIDGDLLPGDPYVRFLQGKQIDVPTLSGQNLLEGVIFAPRALPSSTPQAFIDAATRVFGAANIGNVLKFYPATTADEARTSSVRMIGDLIIGNQTWAWQGAQKATGQSPVYSYLFNQTSAYTPAPIHVSEVPYVFQNLVPKPNLPAAGDQDAALANTMASYWTNFARTGNPNGAGLANWPQYSGPGGQVMALGNTVAPIPEPFTDRFTFLNSFRTNGVLNIHF